MARALINDLIAGIQPMTAMAMPIESATGCLAMINLRIKDLRIGIWMSACVQGCMRVKTPQPR
jgi:hypothetical protein